MNLNDLPDEVLCQIFDHLDLCELKLASLVCRRWAELTFSGQRMDRVWLVQPDGGWELVLNTRRSYRNIRQPFWGNDGRFESLAQLLRTLKFPVRMLNMRCTVTSQQVRCILLEVPELQHLSIEGYIDLNCTTAFPVLTKLKYLRFYYSANNQLDFFRTNVLSLQSLYMSCGTDRELAAWRYMSGQLKLVHVYGLNSIYCSQFLELTFPHLENFTIGEIHCSTTEEIASSRSNDFFRRHCLLRRLSVSVPISVECIRSITSHCPELTYLPLTLVNPEEGILDSLVQLTKLRHLSFRQHSKEYFYSNRSQCTKLDKKLFHGAINSLESVELTIHPTRVFLENLFEAAPQLNYLNISSIYCNNLQLDIEFICEKFSYLRRLQLDMDGQRPADNSVRIDRLEHLEELKICNARSISFIHRNNVRSLTLKLPKIKNKDLGQITEKFPRLNRLTIDSCSGLSESGIIWLHKMIPSCRIDFGSQRFYPQVYPLERRSARIKARKS